MNRLIPEVLMELAGTCALITGGGSGLGGAIAETLLSRGIRLAVHYFSSESQASRIVNTARSKGIQAASFQADLRSTDEIRSLVLAVEKTFKTIDILVNNAAVLHRSPFDQLTAPVWDETLDLNLRATALLCTGMAGRMVKRGRGKIINIGDLAGLEPWPAYLAHATAKAGVHHLTKCLALALAPLVQVNAVVPGFVDPPDGWSARRIERYKSRIPGGTSVTATEIADAVLSLISHDSITGQILIVDRGQSLSF